MKKEENENKELMVSHGMETHKVCNVCSKSQFEYTRFNIGLVLSDMKRIGQGFLEQFHGGGNGRRLMTQFLGEIQKEIDEYVKDDSSKKLIDDLLKDNNFHFL